MTEAASFPIPNLPSVFDFGGLPFQALDFAEKHPRAVAANNRIALLFHIFPSFKVT
jgi:hypothetical protein